jgi:carbon-monoxide dehydrogenase small subunit
VSETVTITLVVNGRRVTRSAGGHLTLLRWLRDAAGVTDPKYGCGEGVCGACTVLVDGEPISSCIMLAAQADGAEVTTAAGLLERDGSLGPLQRAFHIHHAAQCGFCTPGMLMSAAALLAEGGTWTREQIRAGLHGNLCRCTGYGPIVDAVEAAQQELSQRAPGPLWPAQRELRQRAPGPPQQAAAPQQEAGR